MKKYQLKKIDIKSVAKLYLIFGLIFGLIAGMFSVFAIVASSPRAFWPTLISAFFFICIYALMGAIGAAIATWIYNLAASKIGGIVLYLKEEQYLSPGPLITLKIQK
ncbi:hypothetical protein BBF96_00800 [Anoxybacter fermentans]|uniref:DUF3566 domain-containing protein n=1 Tax=Anoxybacter fermentans TaxID=1323375 RepID=A0A3Q9HNG8_9FIRM|nr:hypothetical protein [Anoxybacter fermentans]AZR72056.1 hypothetical protein BBF96_00800 [Anoxybacter fermentans]